MDAAVLSCSIPCHSSIAPSLIFFHRRPALPISPGSLLAIRDNYSSEAFRILLPPFVLRLLFFLMCCSMLVLSSRPLVALMIPRHTQCASSTGRGGSSGGQAANWLWSLNAASFLRPGPWLCLRSNANKQSDALAPNATMLTMIRCATELPLAIASRES